MEQPILETARLLLRPFVLSDAPDVQRLAGAPEVADTTLNLPHPYEVRDAEQWISSQPVRFASSSSVAYAVTRRTDGILLGAISLMEISARHRRAELGYWLGVPFWNQGYMTEAAAALIGYSFSELGLHKITAGHFTRNPASGRVMQKIGMIYEGVQRQHVCKNGVFENNALYGLLADEWRVRP
jgi:ribosomal-protein-alanine N-acetyltransferase